MSSKRNIMISAIILALAAPLPLLAKEGFYVGGGIGWRKASNLKPTESEYNSTLASAGLAGADTKYDKKDAGFKILGGYKFATTMSIKPAVELSYVNLGEVEIQTGVGLNGEIELDGVGLSLKMSSTISDAFDLYAKIGGFRWDAEAALTGVSSLTFVDDGISLTGGLGAETYMNDNFSLRTEWEYFSSMGDKNITGEANAHLLSIIGAYHF